MHCRKEKSRPTSITIIWQKLTPMGEVVTCKEQRGFQTDAITRTWATSANRTDAPNERLVSQDRLLKAYSSVCVQRHGA